MSRWVQTSVGRVSFSFVGIYNKSFTSSFSNSSGVHMGNEEHFFLFLIPFKSIYHARTFIPRQNCPNSNMV
jgi:hypothetical protein